MENNRKKDMNVEREIAAFLDKNLYSNKELFSEFARTDGIDEQISGSDLILSTSDKKLYRTVVDEKVAARYANTSLDTFSLELSFMGKEGKKRCGWFLDYSKTTQYYLLGWIIKADIEYNEENKRYDTDTITRDNIRELEWCLVSRQKIAKFLEKKGWTLDKLAKQDDSIRQRGYVKTKDFVDDLSFRYSDRYVEKPINILLRKQTYMDISDYHGKIIVQKQTMDGNKEIKQDCT
jgi:hypothetical protein